VPGAGTQGIILTGTGRLETLGGAFSVVIHEKDAKVVKAWQKIRFLGSQSLKFRQGLWLVLFKDQEGAFHACHGRFSGRHTHETQE
jgi:hypothetical protein